MIAIIGSMFNVVVDYQIKEIIDTIALDQNANVEALLLLFVFYKFMHHGLFFIRRLLDMKFKPILLSETVTDMYTKTLGHSLHWFDSHLSGEISNKISDFQSNVLTLITHCFNALNSVGIIVIGILFLFNVSALPAVTILVFVMIYTPVITLLLKKQMQLQEQYVSARQETLGIINDSITNIFGIKIIGNIKSEFKLKLTPALLNWSDWEKKTRKFDAYFVDNADTIMVLIQSATQIYLLSYLYKTDQITAGVFAFAAMIMLKVHYTLDEFLENLLFNINPGIASIKASFDFINTKHDTPDSPNAKFLTNVRGDIKFKNVSFAYSGSQTNVLHDFNLHIEAGQRIGIVGTSGAGKTTLIKCLLRYFDVRSGEILIDEQNIISVTQESLRANISVIPQDITMFHRSILENLQLAKYDASFDEIVSACKKARVHQDIMHMVHDYNSIVGERGVKVSGGQRQRIAIARAILKNAPILILDEATSALDTPTEKLIQESLNEMLETNNATTIVIAHRLSTLLYMDRILVLEQGKIIEMGTHQELLAKAGLYKTLWDAQVGGFLPDKK
ncbi:Putative multidrug export ATP-binding/permease protein [Candidatus Trichorickettsia mobilis]|uniref:Multidrug export ATP-binding/permease protein n=1 Tax=Candidatus Trichorickettsia mobilis TaxID=1346319 RepID=A0ABZ0UUF6_9RICK|nr:ABC transporter ATP-binding protein [Candidatus Trichorickettsia mobilis]WPY00835.1 Putative multidrug export ATP-binding/permease protein [Candidatus Trichorickettsia mobilis]